MNIRRCAVDHAEESIPHCVYIAGLPFDDSAPQVALDLMQGYGVVVDHAWVRPDEHIVYLESVEAQRRAVLDFRYDSRYVVKLLATCRFCHYRREVVIRWVNRVYPKVMIAREGKTSLRFWTKGQSLAFNMQDYKHMSEFYQEFRTWVH